MAPPVPLADPRIGPVGHTVIGTQSAPPGGNQKPAAPWQGRIHAHRDDPGHPVQPILPDGQFSGAMLTVALR